MAESALLPKSIAATALTTFNSQKVRIRFTASLEMQQTFNLIASFGEREERPFVITTPISGWFNCAGERGTGIALAIELARQLGQRAAVDCLFANGHELGYLGGENLVQDYPKVPKAILHLGSCIANIDGDIEAICSLQDTKFSSVRKDLQGWVRRFTRPRKAGSRQSWMGESECWAESGIPMLSIAGQSPLFHTPRDVPGRATSAELLEEAMTKLNQGVVTMAGFDRVDG